MRLWSLHSNHLDTKGLVALWREGLLAQAVLLGETRGYRLHPQLNRFRDHASPIDAIGAYLWQVYNVASARGFRFDQKRICHPGDRPGEIPVSRGQIAYEREHLLAKLAIRSPDALARLEANPLPDAHPLFRIVEGGIAAWERISASAFHPRSSDN